MNFAELWAARMMNMAAPLKYTCSKCHLVFDTSTALADHLQRHKVLPRVYNLTQSDKEFLRSIKIDPWADEEVDEGTENRG